MLPSHRRRNVRGPPASRGHERAFWEHHMRYAAFVTAMLLLIAPASAAVTPEIDPQRLAQRGPAMDLQLPGQAGLRPCAGGRARAVSRADVQGAGEFRHLSRLHRRRDRIEPGQGRAARQQLLSGGAGGRVGDRPRHRLFRIAGLAQSVAQGRAEDARAQGDDRRLSRGQAADARQHPAGGDKTRHARQIARGFHDKPVRQGRQERR